MSKFKALMLSSLTLGCIVADMISAQVIVSPTTTIVTPVPAPKEVIVAPTGYTECTEIPARWYNGIWYAGYKACRYNNTGNVYQGGGWVAGHWTCTNYTLTNEQATCTNWDWVAGHWVANYEEIEVH